MAVIVDKAFKQKLGKAALQRHLWRQVVTGVLGPHSIIADSEVHVELPQMRKVDKRRFREKAQIESS